MIFAALAVAHANAGVPARPSPAPSAAAAGSAAPSRSNHPVATGSGFAPTEQTLFAPIVELAPAGPYRAARAMAILDRQLAFQRKISFHPEIGESLQKVIDVMPPRQSTMIRAAALYSRDDIPWSASRDATHEIAVAGRPDGTNYQFSLSPRYVSPEEPERMAGMFALTPVTDSRDGGTQSVIGTLGGELLIDTYGGGAIVDMTAAMLREVRGDLKPPWDTVEGGFNHHDEAALARFSRDMPALAACIGHYLKINNVLDEFDRSGVPVVLFNLDAEVRTEALRPYPHLYNFYRKVASVVAADSAIIDSHGNYWMRTRFDHGRIRIIFMDRGGTLTPFNAAFAPAGDGVALETIARGEYRTEASIIATRLGMNFGLAQVGFTTDFTRDSDSVAIQNRMNEVPALVAPPGIHKLVDLIAGGFLRALAQGHGGLSAAISSRRQPGGMYRFAAGLHGEFDYSPTLEFLARIGDAIADEHNDEVRAEERKLGEGLFDALVADYNNARAKILDLDSNQDSPP